MRCSIHALFNLDAREGEVNFPAVFLLMTATMIEMGSCGKANVLSSGGGERFRFPTSWPCFVNTKVSETGVTSDNPSFEFQPKAPPYV